jgi:hypothetical protein
VEISDLISDLISDFHRTTPFSLSLFVSSAIWSLVEIPPAKFVLARFASSSGFDFLATLLSFPLHIPRRISICP